MAQAPADQVWTAVKTAASWVVDIIFRASLILLAVLFLVMVLDLFGVDLPLPALSPERFVYLAGSWWLLRMATSKGS